MGDCREYINECDDCGGGCTELYRPKDEESDYWECYDCVVETLTPSICDPSWDAMMKEYKEAAIAYYDPVVHSSVTGQATGWTSDSHVAVNGLLASGRLSLDESAWITAKNVPPGTKAAQALLDLSTVYDELYGITRECTHSWSKYQGFTDTYDYCTKCDERRS